MIRKILLIGVILAAIGGGYGYYMWNKKTPSTESRSADIALTASELATQFDNAKHAGKIIAVKGKVSDMETAADGTTNVNLETDDPMVAISCEMEKGSQTLSVKAGDEVTIKGQCDGKLTDIVFTRCIIVK